jgi:ERCC4-type nuclease
MIRVDTNSAENGVFGALQRMNVPSERQRLDVGDITISNGARTFVIERKQWSDLAASICDGRFKEQKSRMVSTENTLYMYVIEGSLGSWDASCRGMKHTCMWAALTKTCLRDGVPVFHTLTETDTASLCAYLYTQLSTNGFDPLPGNGVVSGSATKRKRENLDSPTDALRAMLCVIPGVSKAKADILVQRWSHATLLSSASESEISNLKCGDRNIGPSLARRIRSIFAPQWCPTT